MKAAGIAGLVYLTTTGTGCGLSQIPADSRSKALTGGKPHIQAGVIWEHNLIAALVACRLGVDGYELPGELHTQKGSTSPDAIAHDGDNTYLIEVERMIGQGVQRWLHEKGLVNKIWLHLLGRQTRENTWVLAITPRQVGSCQDAEAWLVDAAQKRGPEVRKEVLANQHIWDSSKVAPNFGFYWLNIEAPSGAPVWHPLTLP